MRASADAHCLGVVVVAIFLPGGDLQYCRAGIADDGMAAVLRPCGWLQNMTTSAVTTSVSACGFVA
jgi:hypothetical protein